MKLKTYLSKHQLYQAEFARSLSKISGNTVGACAALVNRIVNYDHIPVPEMVVHINTLTNGEVPPNDIYTLKKKRGSRK